MKRGERESEEHRRIELLEVGKARRYDSSTDEMILCLCSGLKRTECSRVLEEAHEVGLAGPRGRGAVETAIIRQISDVEGKNAGVNDRNRGAICPPFRNFNYVG